MWFLPSFGRPGRCQEALDLIAVAEPSEGYVVIDEAQRGDYRNLRLPPGWIMIENPAGLSFCQTLNWIFGEYSYLDWYGLTCDDFMVRTADWSAPLVAAAGSCAFANSADGWQAGGPDKRMHGAAVFGGDLLRAFGWWAPPGLVHCFCEDFWEQVGRELKNWRYVPDVVVEHCHAWNGKAPNDPTYEKAYRTFDADKARYGELSRDVLPAALARAAALLQRRATEKSMLDAVSENAWPDPGPAMPDQMAPPADAWKIADEAAHARLVAFDGTQVVVGAGLARIAALPNEAWAAFAWKVVGEDFGLVAPGSLPWPTPVGAEAEVLERWLRSDARNALNQRLAEALGGKVIQFCGEDVRLALCTPIGGHRPDWAWVASRDATGALCSQMGIFCATHTVFGGSHVGKAREHLLWDAMATPATHILFVDDDMGWDPRILMRLIAADMDFVAAVGCRKQETFSVCCNFLPNPQRFDERTGFLEIQDVGFAFVLLRRAAVERMMEAYPGLEYRTTNGRREWALFLDMIEHGDRLSEDFSFCRRWRAIGGRIFIDQDAALVHAGRKEFTGRPSQLFETAAKDIAA